jgi:hypothetical protein
MGINLQTEIDWEELLGNISDGTVIPIIGNEMYKFDLNGEYVIIDNYLASKLQQEQNIKPATSMSLVETISYLEKENNIPVNKIIRRLKEMVEEVKFEFPLLKSLLKIKQLNFFTNTTVYNLLFEKNVKAVRGQDVVSIDFSIRSKFPDVEDMEHLTVPHVFNVFGSFKSADPALHEEEMLEFTASFKERMNDNAINILDALKNKTLLFLGCSHPDWLIRFFLRVLSNERVNDWLKRPSKIIVVNDLSADRQKQIDFFRNYNAITYEGNTNEFVQELSTNWNKQNPEAVKPKMVFLSYTQKDVQAVENLKVALMNINNVTCWYDKEKLFSGDNFEFTIISNIRNADLFIPLISQNSLTEDKYVLDEWAKADAVSKFREMDGKSERYLMPIVIDNADLNNNIVRKYYPQLSIEPVPEGKADEAFISRLKNVLNLV